MQETQNDEEEQALTSSQVASRHTMDATLHVIGFMQISAFDVTDGWLPSCAAVLYHDMQ